MTFSLFKGSLAAVMLLLAGATQGQALEVVRLGNLRLAHFGAVSYVQEIAPQCGIRVKEKLFARAQDVMDAIRAGELDVGTGPSEVAIAARASGVPIFLVAGFAKGGARLVARRGQLMRDLKGLKGKKVGVTPGGIGEVLLISALEEVGLSAGVMAGRDVQLVYLPMADLNAALMGRKIDAMMQAEPQSSQAISKGYGVEVLKPYDTPIGEPIRTMVMTEAFYHRKRVLAERFMRCFVQATKTFLDDTALAETYVRDVLFKGALSSDDFRAVLANAPYSYNVSPRHIQITTDTLVRTGVGRFAKAPLARDWVRTDLLEEAKKSLRVK